MMHFIISGNIRKEIRNIMSFTELKKLHWLLSNGHFSVISERALVLLDINQETKKGNDFKILFIFFPYKLLNLF